MRTGTQRACRVRRPLGRAWTWFAPCVLMLACKSESSYDVFLRGMQIEGEAERGPCHLVWDETAHVHTIESGDVEVCLNRTEEAIGIYEEAAKKGMRGVEYDRVYMRALERKRRLDSMLRNVRRMELEQRMDKAK